MTALHYYDFKDGPLATLFHHEKYRSTHDVLHFAYRSACGEPCSIRHHILLQDKIVAVRKAERRVQ